MWRAGSLFLALGGGRSRDRAKRAPLRVRGVAEGGGIVPESELQDGWSLLILWFFWFSKNKSCYTCRKFGIYVSKLSFMMSKRPEASLQYDNYDITIILLFCCFAVWMLLTICNFWAMYPLIQSKPEYTIMPRLHSLQENVGRQFISRPTVYSNLREGKSKDTHIAYRYHTNTFFFLEIWTRQMFELRSKMARVNYITIKRARKQRMAWTWLNSEHLPIYMCQLS